MYHYKESGLDDIFLVNGYHIHKTPYGEGVAINSAPLSGRGSAMSPRQD
jgi:putative transcriptional regulator